MLATAPIYGVHSQSQQTVVGIVPAESSGQQGKNVAVNIEVSNVENLYAIDVIVDYNSSVLQLANAEPTLGTRAIADRGILYGSPVVNDTNSIEAGCIYFNTSLSTANEFRLFATSVAPADSFNGSGIVATLTFNIVGSGQSNLVLTSILADHPEPGETTSEEITHEDVSGQVQAAPIPEFPQIALLLVAGACATGTMILARKRFKRLTNIASPQATVLC